jgi:hypothetical protein
MTADHHLCYHGLEKASKTVTNSHDKEGIPAAVYVRGFPLTAI